MRVPIDYFARKARWCLLARHAPIPPASGARRLCGSAFQPVELANGPDERRPAACGCPHADADLPTATGGEALEQAFQQRRAGPMVVRDILHQLPALLADFEHGFGLTEIG